MQRYACFQKRIHPSRAFNFVTSDVRIWNIPVSSSTLSKGLSKAASQQNSRNKDADRGQKESKKGKHRQSVISYNYLSLLIL